MRGFTAGALARRQQWEPPPHRHRLVGLCNCGPFPPLRSGPTTVLVLSLLFIAFVVLLHIWGKFRRG